MLAILKTLTIVFGCLSALLLVFSGIARVIESIYQLSQKPGLNTLGKVIQVIKNFFTLEGYDAKK